jgi:hypothetical protein
MTSFSSKMDAEGPLAAVLDVIERLPAGGQDHLANAAGAVSALRGAIQAVPVVEPSEASGTSRYRQVHGLEPLEDIHAR